MFDLEIIEKDWLENSFKLNEDEIIEIYRSEKVTTKAYNFELEEYRKNTHSSLSPEEILLATFLQEPDTLRKMEEENERKKEYKVPSRKHLCMESQRKIVEGCLYIVFEATRNWNNFFRNKISMEIIYYICLDALMQTVKYTLHPEKPIFKYFVLRNIERNIIKYISRKIHLSYQDTHNLIYNNNILAIQEILEATLSSFETPASPSQINYLLRNEQYSVDYTKNISSISFMHDYNEALDNLDAVSKMIIQLSFDTEGNNGFTAKEIGEFLGIGTKKVYRLKQKALKKLQTNEKISQYHN